MLPQSIIDAYHEERMRHDGYKGPLFRAVGEFVKDGVKPMNRKQVAEIKRRIMEENQSRLIANVGSKEFLRMDLSDLACIECGKLIGAGPCFMVKTRAIGPSMLQARGNGPYCSKICLNQNHPKKP